jgi:hypothetical protein
MIFPRLTWQGCRHDLQHDKSPTRREMQATAEDRRDERSEDRLFEEVGAGDDSSAQLIQPCSWKRFLITSAISLAACSALPSTVLRPLSCP